VFTHQVAAVFLHEMTSWPTFRKYDVISDIGLRQSMWIYSRNNPANFHPDLFLIDEALGFLLKQEQQIQEQDV